MPWHRQICTDECPFNLWLSTTDNQNGLEGEQFSQFDSTQEMQTGVHRSGTGVLATVAEHQKQDENDPPVMRPGEPSHELHQNQFNRL